MLPRHTVSVSLADQNRALAGTFDHEARRLRHFIRRRVADIGDADDILQDVFSELIEAHPCRDADRARRRLPVSCGQEPDHRSLPQKTLPSGANPEGDDDALAAHGATEQHGPEARYANRLRRDDLEAALAELPEAQREVFIAHELEGRSFKSLAAESGVAVNTLLARERYAVLHLRQRLQHHHYASSTRRTS